jgi:peroxiredoxin
MAVKATEPNATYVGSCRTVPTRAWQKEANSAGTVAPDFKLRVTPDQWLSLGDLKGRPVILAATRWHSTTKSFPSSANLALSSWAFRYHEAFAKDRHLHFPLLADFHPKGEVAKLRSLSGNGRRQRTCAVRY